MDTQTANTTSESVSDNTVAPTVIVMGSRFVAPNRLTIALPSNVCDARREPITMAGTSP